MLARWSHAPTTTIHQTFKKNFRRSVQKHFLEEEKDLKKATENFFTLHLKEKTSEKGYWQLQSVLHYKQTQKHLNKKDAQTQ